MTDKKQPEALRLAEHCETYITFQYDEQVAAELRRLHALAESQRAELVAEAARTAEEKLRADQMTEQHRMQCNMRKDIEVRLQQAEHVAHALAIDKINLEAQLSAIGAGGVESLRKREQAESVAWTPGPNEFKDWCSQWFGPDSDDSYLAKAVFNLPPMAQQFDRAAMQAATPAPAAVAATDDHVRDALTALLALVDCTRGVMVPTTDSVVTEAFRPWAKFPEVQTARAAVAAAPAQAQDDRAAFKAYLQECDDCAIVPDVAGAFHAAWQKRAAPAQAVALDYEKELTQAALRNYDLRMEKEALVAALQEQAQEHATQLAGPVLHDIEAGVEVMAWLRENRAPHSIYSKMSACLFGDPDAPRAAPAQAQEDAREPLTDEQVQEFCAEANRGFDIEQEHYFKAFRDAERAHGIAARAVQGGAA